MSEAQALAVRLKGKRAGAGTYYADCPVCSYKGSLSTSEKDDRTLVYCHVGCESATVFAAVREDMGLALTRPGVLSADLERKRQERARDEEARTGAARRLWSLAATPAGSPVETYLRGRGIVPPLPYSIRYLANAKHPETDKRLPCMLSAVTKWPSNRVVAVHRTFLSYDGRSKANVTPAKLTLGPIGGGAVRLAAASRDTLVICEGIETGLSLVRLLGFPVWACLSTGGMRAVTLPETLRQVIIAADHDKPGLEAAEAAKRRLQMLLVGCEVEVIKPDVAGQDFNDLLRSGAY